MDEERTCEYCGRVWTGIDYYKPIPEHDCYVRILRRDWETVLARLALVESVAYRAPHLSGMP